MIDHEPTVPLTHRSTVWLAKAIQQRELSAVEVVDAHLREIDRVNGRINAVVRLAPDALDLAARADERLARGIVDGPLHGVPFTAKDSLDTAGLVTTAGTIGWRDRVPARDATAVTRVKAAGGILLGKTNTPEFTWSDETDNDVYGLTRNPYDLDRTPGGSSGGPAAIVAAAGSPFDIGSDTGDSIRQPAHVCGIAGLKPTSGRVPRTGHWPGYDGLVQSFTVLGPIARYVEDLALVFPILVGPDGEDPHIVPAPLGDPSRVSLPGLQTVVFTDNGVMTPTHETVTAVRAAAAVMAEAGAAIREEVPPLQREAWEAWDGLLRADGFAWLQRLITAAGTPAFGSYDTRGWVTRTPPLAGDALSALTERADRIRGQLLAWAQDVDLIVCPVMPQAAIRHGDSNAAWFGDTYSDVHNLTGWPAVVVRAGATADGLPIGVQLVARPWQEHVALAAALEIERALGGWQPPAL
jgi:amidase